MNQRLQDWLLVRVSLILAAGILSVWPLVAVASQSPGSSCESWIDPEVASRKEPPESPERTFDRIPEQDSQNDAINDAQNDLQQDEQRDEQQDGPHDPDQLLAHGIQVRRGRQITLYTDVKGREDVAQIPEVFDRAIPQWCDYFGVSSDLVASWHITACIMQDPDRFRRAGLFPASLPDFPAGYQVGDRIWMYLQPGSYYTRHLTLHEGTHAFMEKFLGGMGAPWFSEGMAERLALNRWQPDELPDPSALEINFRVTDRDQTPYWGRVKAIQEDYRRGRGLTLRDVTLLPNPSFRDVKYYGWAWAACEFLARHPDTEGDFSRLFAKSAQSPAQFTAYVGNWLSANERVLEQDWNLFIREMDYGVPVERTCLLTIPANSENEGEFRLQLKPDHGWQVTPLAIPRGAEVRISSPSFFHVGSSIVQGQVRLWTTTTNGITLEYYRELPIGMLLAGTVDLSEATPSARLAGLANPIPVGSKGVFTAQFPGQLALRINESPAALADNEGEVIVLVEIIR
jgi:hypothetical protein